MEVLRHDDHVEAGRLGDDGMADEVLGMELLVAAEVCEAGQGVILETGLSG
jgi:hypothetical protein